MLFDHYDGSRPLFHGFSIWLLRWLFDKMSPILQRPRVLELLPADAAHLAGEDFLKSLSASDFFPNLPKTEDALAKSANIRVR